MRGPHAWLGILFFALLAVAFLGMAAVVFPMLQGDLRTSPRRAAGSLERSPSSLRTGPGVSQPWSSASGRATRSWTRWRDSPARRGSPCGRRAGHDALDSQQRGGSAGGRARGVARDFREDLRRGLRPAAARISALCALPRANDADGSGDPRRARGRFTRKASRCCARGSRKTRRYPALSTELPQAQAFERELLRGARNPSGGPPLAQAAATPSRISEEAGGAGVKASPTPVLPRRGTRASTRWPSARSTPGSSSRAISASSATARPCSTWRSSSATSTAARRRCSCDPRRRAGSWSRSRSRETPRSGMASPTAWPSRLSRRGAAALPPRPCAASRWSSSARQPRRRPGRALQRHRLPARRLVVRPAARRVPEPPPGALRQPLRHEASLRPGGVRFGITGRTAQGLPRPPGSRASATPRDTARVDVRTRPRSGSRFEADGRRDAGERPRRSASSGRPPARAAATATRAATIPSASSGSRTSPSRSRNPGT